jgi:hypothetical protein
MQFAYLIWSLILLAIWGTFYFFLKDRESKKEMLLVSLWSMPLGLFEWFFVPAYWTPLTLFDLAARTGLDIETFVFAFAGAGIVSVLYESAIPGRRHEAVPLYERRLPRHRYHVPALLSGPVLFILLLLVTDLNPIYVLIIAPVAGGLLTWYCRPDIKGKMFIGALLFLGMYFVYFLSLVLVFPDYVRIVWNLSAISGVLIAGIPLEELLFAISAGFFWSSMYEHIMWRRLRSRT